MQSEKRSLLFDVLALAILSFYIMSDAVLERLGTYWEFSEGIFPTIVFFAGVLMIHRAMIWCRIPSRKAATIIFLFSVLVFNYQGLLREIGAQASLIVITMIFGISTMLIMKGKEFGQIMFLVLSIMTIPYCLVNTGFILIKVTQKYDLSEIPPPESISLAAAKGQEKKPDIYFIIQDAYAWNRTMKDSFGYDNAPFLDGLRKRGFYVADDSQSLYSQTMLSVASTLNFNYIQNDIHLPHARFEDRGPIINYYLRPRFNRFLKEQGYEMVALTSAYNMDLDFDPGDMEIRGPHFRLNIPMVMINWTPFYQVLSMVFGDQREFLNPFRDHHDGIVDQYGKLKEIAAQGSENPRFVYTHFLCPHPPFVFSADGNFADYSYLMPFSYTDGMINVFSNLYDGGSWTEHYRNAYVEQVRYANSKLEEFIDAVLATPSDRPKVIIIMGDHGSRMEVNFGSTETSNSQEIFGILNAVYYSDGAYDGFTQDINPVNVMRLTLNKYFGFTLPVVENRTWFSMWRTPYDFVDVTGAHNTNIMLKDDAH